MTDKAKLYVVKNDEGKYWEYNLHAWGVAASNGCTCSRAVADAVVDFHGGHVVELVEAPAKVVVREEEAEMLEQAKCDDDPAELIVGFVNSHDKYDDDRKAEDRLMRAYVNGWTVEKPKLWNVKVPHVNAQEGLWFFVNSDGKVDATYDQDLAQKFTAAEIEQYGLGDCERVEVTDDEQ